jgi:hypothetical protein
LLAFCRLHTPIKLTSKINHCSILIENHLAISVRTSVFVCFVLWPFSSALLICMFTFMPTPYCLHFCSYIERSKTGSQAPVVYTRNPSYLRGRDQEAQALRTA